MYTYYISVYVFGCVRWCMCVVKAKLAKALLSTKMLAVIVTIVVVYLGFFDLSFSCVLFYLASTQFSVGYRY